MRSKATATYVPDGHVLLILARPPAAPAYDQRDRGAVRGVAATHRRGEANQEGVNATSCVSTRLSYCRRGRRAALSRWLTDQSGPTPGGRRLFALAAPRSGHRGVRSAAAPAQPANTRRRWRELERAETQGWSCREFRGVVITEEIAHRQQTRNPALGQTGSLPVPEDRLPRYPEWLHRSLRHRRGADRELVGGQPSRQIARGTRSLPAAARPDHRRSWLSIYPTDRDAANVLFHIVNERNQRRRPMLFTTNKPPLTTWGDVLHDHDLAEAIVDGVLERGRLLLLDGPSIISRAEVSSPSLLARRAGPDDEESTDGGGGTAEPARRRRANG